MQYSIDRNVPHAKQTSDDANRKPSAGDDIDKPAIPSPFFIRPSDRIAHPETDNI
jgi:hypothetical protein